MKTIVVRWISVLAVICSAFSDVAAQTDDEQLSRVILQKDSLFWKAYNNCDTSSFRNFIDEDIEFYHDKGGITAGLHAFNMAIKNNLCSNPDFHIRRGPVAGTIKLFPLRQSDVLYGAILTGDHLFYISETGKAERAEGQAKFTHLWLLKDGNWKMSRILSFDHRPIAYKSTKTTIRLNDKMLDVYTGKYHAPQTGNISIARENNQLVMVINDSRSLIYPEKLHLFFLKERDISFEFSILNNKASKFVVRENGKIVEEAIRVK